MNAVQFIGGPKDGEELVVDSLPLYFEFQALSRPLSLVAHDNEPIEFRRIVYRLQSGEGSFFRYLYDGIR